MSVNVHIYDFLNGMYIVGEFGTELRGLHPVPLGRKILPQKVIIRTAPPPLSAPTISRFAYLCTEKIDICRKYERILGLLS